jgi:large subunit ribosomal protein L15
MIALNNSTQIKIKKLRVGRGIGSGKGKTSGRGAKGQKSRSGVAIKSFEGGQMPLFRRLPKRGFKSLKKDRIAIINLGKIQSLLDSKKINSESKIDLDLLKNVNVVNKCYQKIKILGFGELKDKIDINADYFSKSAQKKLEKIGGSITPKNKI